MTKKGPSSFRLIQVVLAISFCVGSTRGELFRESLSNSEFEARRMTWVNRIAEARALAEKGMPAVGSMVAEIRSGSRSEELGFQIGDVLPTLDGQTLWGNITRKERGGLTELVHFTKSGERSTFKVPPGLLGYYLGYFCAPELDFLREQKEASDTLELALLGLITIDEDPSLAEAAWHRAMQIGYQSDGFSRYSEMMLSIGRDGFFDLVSAFHDEFVEGKEIKYCFLEGIVSAATSCGHFETLQTLCDQLEYFYWTKEELNQLERFADNSPALDDDLLTRVRKRPYRVIGEELQNDARYNEIDRQAGVDSFKRNRQVVVSQNRIRRSIVCGPEPLKNVHVSVALGEIGPSQLSKRYSNQFLVALTHGDYETHSGSGFIPSHDMNLICAGFEFLDHSADRSRIPNFFWRTSGFGTKWRTNAAFVSNLRDQPNDGTITTAKGVFLDIIRLDSEVACYVNGLQYLKMTVDPTIENLSIVQTVTGCLINGFDCVVREILPPEP